jgi:hypothetical protein
MPTPEHKKILSRTEWDVTLCSLVTSVNFYRTTRRHIPEDSTVHSHLCDNHKPNASTELTSCRSMPWDFPSVWDQLKGGKPLIGCVKSPPFPSLSFVVCCPSIHLLSILRTSRISLSQMSAGYVCSRFIVSSSQGIGKHPQFRLLQMGSLSCPSEQSPRAAAVLCTCFSRLHLPVYYNFRSTTPYVWFYLFNIDTTFLCFRVRV